MKIFKKVAYSLLCSLTYAGLLLGGVPVDAVSQNPQSPQNHGKVPTLKTLPDQALLKRQIDQANMAAAQERYLEAIEIYESVIQHLPQEQTLKNNLIILYANYGVQLQNQKRYTEARLWLDRSLKQQPDQPEVIRAKATNFFYQALELLNQNSQNFVEMRALMEEAIKLKPEESAFQKGMATLWVEEARVYIDQGDFKTALPLLEKALTYDSTHETLRRALVNVYLRLASEEKDQEKRDAYGEKALALDASDEIKDRFEKIRKGEAVLQKPSHGFLGNSLPDTKSTETLSVQTTKLSLDEMLRDIESHLNKVHDPKIPLIQRLTDLESDIYGEVKTGPLAVRVKTLYTHLLGERKVLGGQEPQGQLPIETSENAYLDEIFKVTEGRVIRWGKFPLRVYLDEPKNLEGFQAAYLDAVKQGIAQWKTKTENFITVVYVKNRLAADIQIDWATSYTDRFDVFLEEGRQNPGKDFYKNYTPPKHSPLMNVLSIASMLTPGYYSLAPQALGAAMQYQQAKKLQVLIDESKIILGLDRLKELDADQACRYLQLMAAHEFGHALGIKGHSLQSADLMSPLNRFTSRSVESVSISPRDLETLRQLYNRPANIVLNVR